MKSYSIAELNERMRKARDSKGKTKAAPDERPSRRDPKAEAAVRREGKR